MQRTIPQAVNSDATNKTTSRPVKRRAPLACQGCRLRKVRCNLAEEGVPCTNCRLDQVECVVPEGVRKRCVILPEFVVALESLREPSEYGYVVPRYLSSENHLLMFHRRQPRLHERQVDKTRPVDNSDMSKSALPSNPDSLSPLTNSPHQSLNFEERNAKEARHSIGQHSPGSPLFASYYSQRSPRSKLWPSIQLQLPCAPKQCIPSHANFQPLSGAEGQHSDDRFGWATVPSSHAQNDGFCGSPVFHQTTSSRRWSRRD